MRKSFCLFKKVSEEEEKYINVWANNYIRKRKAGEEDFNFIFNFFIQSFKSNILYISDQWQEL